MTVRCLHVKGMNTPVEHLYFFAMCNN